MKVRIGGVMVVAVAGCLLMFAAVTIFGILAVVRAIAELSREGTSLTQVPVVTVAAEIVPVLTVAAAIVPFVTVAAEIVPAVTVAAEIVPAVTVAAKI